MCQAGFRLRQDTLENCWALDLHGTWSDLNAGFSKEHRKKNKKAAQRLAESSTSIRTIADKGFDSIWKISFSYIRCVSKSIGDRGCFSNSRWTRLKLCASKLKRWSEEKRSHEITVKLCKLRKSGFTEYFIRSNENTNGRIRRFWPKKIDRAKFIDQEIDNRILLLNLTPRKVLGDLTPLEVFIGRRVALINLIQRPQTTRKYNSPPG
jgi:hypothetical protein